MKTHSFFVLFFSAYVYCSVISNVRLVDHTSYVIEYITKTINIVEERGWCNLKLPDYEHAVNQSVLHNNITGRVQYTNGFVSSIQGVDIQQSTVQQVWFFNTTIQKTTVSVRGTLRMHDVAIGYDVITNLSDDNKLYTTVFVHPLISYAFSVIKDVNTDEVEVTVVGTVPRITSRLPEFRPLDTTTDMLTSMFDPNVITPDGMLAWGPEVFQPIAYELVTKEIPFPTICYDCAT